MNIIKTLEQISRNDKMIAGGKGAVLGEMRSLGLPVPAGFIIPAEAFKLFLEKNIIDIKIKNILNEIQPNNDYSIKIASEKIMFLIEKSEFDGEIVREIERVFFKLNSPLVAVRSSAKVEDSNEYSWPGVFESYLNVDKDNLLKSIKKCWLSLFSVNALSYGLKNNIQFGKNVSMAVVVQEMVQSEKSGIAFTMHPITRDNNHIVLEAGLGLGLAIANGEITPDMYVINKKNKKINKAISEQNVMFVRSSSGMKRTKISKEIAKKQKISDVQIMQIFDICKNIEKHFDRPQDIEWAVAKNKIYITQARPITT